MARKGGTVAKPCPACMLSCFSCVQLFVITWTSPPGFSVHEILQARILESVAIPFSRGSSQHRMDPPLLTSPALADEFFTTSRVLLGGFKVEVKEPGAGWVGPMDGTCISNYPCFWVFFNIFLLHEVFCAHPNHNQSLLFMTLPYCYAIHQHLICLALC